MVVVIIGLRAALGRPTFQRVRQRAVSKPCRNDAGQGRARAEREALENGDFPANGIGGLHAGLRGDMPGRRCLRWCLRRWRRWGAGCWRGRV